MDREAKVEVVAMHSTTIPRCMGACK